MRTEIVYAKGEFQVNGKPLDAMEALDAAHARGLIE